MAEENADQKEFWEGFSGKWVSQQDALDAAFAPVLDGVLSRAALVPGQHVLDIGCGTGTSTLLAGKAVSPAGSALGVDISEQMLAQARRTAEDAGNVVFETADAADHAFAPATFDTVISRFGTMFFADSVAAFSNILRAMKPGAVLTMAAWSHMDANPWFRDPMRAAKARLGVPPALDPDAPGPLAFRDPARVCGLLETVGFSDAHCAVSQLHLTPPGEAGDAARLASSIGPASRAMGYFNGDEADFEAIAGRVAADFAAYATQAGMKIPAGINFFTAVAPDR